MKTILLLVFGVSLGVLISWFYSPAMMSSADQDIDKKPLYWVAPMDPNYQRDEPGQSPMGMDLIPVYEQENNASKAGPGAISVAPNVVNSLGVRTAKVQLKTLNNSINTVGYVHYNQDAIVHVHPRVEGWVETLHVKAEGDRIQQGEPLYVVYSPQLVNAQEEYLLALKRNNPRLIQAARGRLGALALNKNFIKRLGERGRVQQNITYYAPQSGIISELKAREGFYIKPDANIMTLVNLDEIWVEAAVMQQQAHALAKGLDVAIYFEHLPGEPLAGNIDYVYPSVDQATRTTRVRVRLDNKKGLLKPGMFAKVLINNKSSQQVLSVPRTAVIRTGTQDRVVLALGEGQFKSIAVTIGRADQHSIEITEGLNTDDEVVISAQFLLDSESSKTSDFMRMQANEMPDSVWVEATVDMLMPDSPMIKLTHEAIDAWDWPVMTMMFMVDESLDISSLKQGLTFHAQLQRSDDNEFTLIGLHIPDEEMKAKPVKPDDSRSEKMDHRAINHEAINHGEGNHD